MPFKNVIHLEKSKSRGSIMVDIKPEAEVLNGLNQFRSFKAIVVIRVHELSYELIACIGHLFSISSLRMVRGASLLPAFKFVDALSEEYGKLEEEVEVVFVSLRRGLPQVKEENIIAGDVGLSLDVFHGHVPVRHELVEEGMYLGGAEAAEEAAVLGEHIAESLLGTL